MDEPKITYSAESDSVKDVDHPPPPLPKRNSISASFIKLYATRRRFSLPTIIPNYCSGSHQKSSTRTKMIIGIAIVILFILSTVFMALYFTTNRDKSSKLGYESRRNRSTAYNFTENHNKNSTKKGHHPSPNKNTMMHEISVGKVGPSTTKPKISERKKQTKERTLGSCEFGNWQLSFNRNGWSTCPVDHRYISGLARTKALRYRDHINNLEGAQCCKGDGEYACEPGSCKDVSWMLSFDKSNTWNKCPAGHFISGLRRSASSDGGGLHNIENARCCRPVTAPEHYRECYTQDIWSDFDYNVTKMVTCSKRGYFITGLYRSSCDLLSCIDEFQCCSMAKTTNVAHFKSTEQSSTVWGGISSRAVDRIIVSDYYFASCTHTLESSKPWWGVDLGEEYNVIYVKITNRIDCCSERLNGFEVRIGNNSLGDNGNLNPKCGWTQTVKDGKPIKVVCQSPMKGRYVNIVIPGNKKILTLCEVEVYA